MAAWFVEIGQLRHFCDRHDITLCDDTCYTSENSYMDYYLEVSGRRVGKPKHNIFIIFQINKHPIYNIINFNNIIYMLKFIIINYLNFF